MFARCEALLAQTGSDHCVLSIGTAIGAVLTAGKILFGSVSVGCSLGFLSALILKHMCLFHHEEHFSTELVLIMLFPYIAWMMAEAMALSGIVAILFCGIVMAHYTTLNLHPKTLDLSRKLFKVIAYAAETFVFVYMGLALFCFRQDFTHPWVILVSVGALLVARGLNVFPLAAVVNSCRRKERIISFGHQAIMWFAGLRGAIAFALALKARENYATRDAAGTPGAGRAIFTATLATVLFTVLGMGAGIFNLLEQFKAFNRGNSLEDDQELLADRRGSRLLKFDR